MISQLSNQDPAVAAQIEAVFQVSYPFEALLLNVPIAQFPPMKRTKQDFLHASTEFYGFHADRILAAVMEVRRTKAYVHLQSMVVHPDYFRQGIASKMVDFLFANYPAQMYKVETGAKNTPAILLYQQFDFQIVKTIQTPEGIEKVGMERKGI